MRPSPRTAELPCLRRATVCCVLASLAMIACTVGMAADSPALAGRKSMQAAVAALRSGNEAEAVPLLEANALGGDPRAQYLLGALYLTGKSVTRNNSLGYAWLQVATSSNGNFVGWSDREAVELMLTMQPLMTGKDLVEADRTAAAIEARIDTVRMELLRPALTLYSPAPAHMLDGRLLFDDPEVRISMPEGPSAEPLARIGCADVERTDCPAHRNADRPACTGRIVRSDSVSSGQGGDVKIVTPNYPLGARRQGLTGRTVMLAHVDASGWICSVRLAQSSGDNSIDRAALDAVRLWRIKPAVAGGQPVESLFALSAVFELY